MFRQILRDMLLVLTITVNIVNIRALYKAHVKMDNIFTELEIIINKERNLRT